MKILIFAGGTGSIALQEGIYHALEAQLDGIETKIVVNAYDNGLSTGTVRSVLDGRILGPSDVRKNQATRLRLKSPGDPWLSFLECRFTVETPVAHDFCRHRAGKLVTELERQNGCPQLERLLFGAIEEFFQLPAASTIAYDDFSIANILYAGLASKNGQSLRAAAKIMADAMNVPDNVLLNDDSSLFLGAVTQSGRRLSDEGEIVCWGSETDPIVDVFFVDPAGKKSTPTLCLEAWQAIVEADLLILSTGTQWSSLIPTYASRGFKAAVRDSKAKIVLVMNRTPDKDSPGQTASDIINVLVPRYFDSGRLNVLMDTNGHPSMSRLNQSALEKISRLIQTELSTAADRGDRHNPGRLVEAVGNVYFNEYLDSKFFLFDYDDTLVGRGNSCPKSSRFNTEAIARLNHLTDLGICTGNTVKVLNFGDQLASDDRLEGKPLLVFADGGINEYLYDTHSINSVDCDLSGTARCISPDSLLPTAGSHGAGEIINALKRAGIPGSKIENRGNALIAIRPVDHALRHAVLSLARSIVYGSDLEVRETGKTTIEIRSPSLSKVHALKHLCMKHPNFQRITYVGDECESGNDCDVEEFATRQSGVRCLHVDGPAKTAFFIFTLLTRVQKNASL